LVAAHAAEVEHELAGPADRRMRRQVVDLAGGGERATGVDHAGALAQAAGRGDLRRGDVQRHAQAVTRDSSPYASASSGALAASISARSTMARHGFQVASSCILPSIMWAPRPSGIA